MDQYTTHPMSVRQILMLVLLLLFAACLRGYQLDQPPEKIFDEYHYVGAAQVMAGVAENSGKVPDPYYHHPPLGKLLIAGGIRFFGDSAFGWRICAVFFGVISIWLLFQLAYKLFNSFLLAWSAALVYSLDFLHIIHSRVAMLDIFLVAPVLGGMLSLVCLLEKPRSGIWMALSTFSWALAMSMKTSALIYLVVFLVVYFIISRQRPVARVNTLAVIVLGTALLFTSNYFFYFIHDYSFSEWLQLRLGATTNFTSRAPAHPYESPPAMWLFNTKAIWYAFDKTNHTGILGFGNPALWLAFFPAVFVVFSEYRRVGNPQDLFLLVWFGLSYLPFFLILWHRGGFLYYMLPAVAPMVLIVIRALSVVANRRATATIVAYLTTVFATLLLFLPLVLSLPMAPEYQEIVARLFYS